MKCPFVSEEFLQRDESLTGRYALGDPQIHLWEMFHDPARLVQVVFVADESPCAGIFENMLEFSRSI